MASHPDYTARSKRYTVGFLSERASFASESLIFQGAQQAVAQYDIHLLYIAPLEDNDNADHFGSADVRSDEEVRQRHDRMKAYLDSFELDGLIGIGWARAFNDDNGPYLLERLKPLPLVTIGKSLSADIPSIITPGGPYIKQLALHLAGKHQLRHIAYVCPWSDDERLESYVEAMQEAGQYDEQLIVRTEDIGGSLGIEQRIQRAAAILLDERELPVDAIMVMTAYECKFMLEALHARGLRIPEDIALVCCEDDPIVENAAPSITTIDYPYHKLGHAACELLVQQLEGHAVPARTEVATVIRYRDSCGCTVNDVKPMQPLPSELSLDAQTAAGLTPAAIGELLKGSMPSDLHGFDCEGLASSFWSSIEQRTGGFLETFSREIHRSLGQATEGLDQLVDRFRDAFLPLVHADRGRYELAEALWFGARHILKNYMSGLALTRSIQENDKNRFISHIYQQLQTVEYISDVPKVLNRYLGWLQIPSICILLNPPEAPQPEASRPFFCFGDDFAYRQDDDLQTLYRLQRDAKGGRTCLVISPLLMNGERLGFIWAKPGKHRTSTLITLFEQIGSAIKNAQVQEESREQEARLAYYANVDSLTRLFNRRYFYDALAAAGGNRSFSVLYIDIDGFKQVNDTHGHDAGDMLLVQIADRIRHTLADGAFSFPQPFPQLGLTEMGSIFRLGGDEFTALLRTTDVEETAAYALQLCAALRSPYMLGSHTVRVSASIGLARYPEDTADAHQLLKLADLALYSAKECKDRYRFYHELN